MKKLLALLIFFPVFAWAQCNPNPFTPNAALTASALNAAINTPCITGGAIKNATITQTATGHFDSSLGAVIDRFNDRAFIGTATQNDGKTSSSTSDWTGTVFSVGGVPAFKYLEDNSQFNVGATGGQLGSVFATRASDGPGNGQASIGVSSVVLNDNAIGSGATTFNYYGTAVRTAASTGPASHGLELDITNLGANVPIYPSNPAVGTGLTANLWMASGGELANQAGGSYTINNTSAGLVFLSNSQGYPNARFDKGIVFGANSLNSNNAAIAFYAGHQMQWFNASNQITGQIYSSATTTASGQSIILSPFGLLVNDMAGKTQFQINNGANNAANYLQINAANTGLSPSVIASGSDPNINLAVSGKGGGVVIVGGNTIANGTGTLALGTAKTLTASNTLTLTGTDGSSVNFGSGGTVAYVLTGTTGSLGGSALAAGQCSFANVTVIGVTTSMTITSTPVTYPGDGFYWVSYMSAANNVTTKVCAAVAGTPTASAYNIRVLQ